jgi:hypothetical protein
MPYPVAGVRVAREGTGVADGDGLGDGPPTVGDGLALGVGLGDAAPGDRLAPGRLVGVGVGVVRWARGRSGWVTAGVGAGDDVLVAGASPTVVWLGGATST